MKVLDIVPLGRSLDREAMKAKAAIEAIPEDISVDDEFWMIQAASTAAADIAQRIAAMSPRNKREAAVHARAAAWLEGTYWG
ncbi:hypothetical protein [Microvirga sp. TS319]|uniref:hypothetical protein n=1 Tax=Microvirga sp. TS319 TaxID=3241165 RepID=UPI00351A9E75